MEKYKEGLITGLAITFWVWFPILLFILALIVGTIIFVKSKKNADPNLNSYTLSEVREKSIEESGNKKKRFSSKNIMNIKDKDFLEEHLEEIHRRIGEKRNYYILIFSNSCVKYNISGFLVGPFWMGYRGMFREIFIFLGIIGMIDYIVYFWGLNSAFNFGIVISILLGKYGNYLYFKSLERRILNQRKEINRFLGLFLGIFLYALYIVLSTQLYSFS